MSNTAQRRKEQKERRRKRTEAIEKQRQDKLSSYYLAQILFGTGRDAKITS